MKAPGTTILICRMLCARKGHTKAACTIATYLGAPGTLSNRYNNSIDGDAMTSVCEIRP